MRLPIPGGSVLLVLGVIYLKQWLKVRALEQASKVLSDRPMSCLGTPLISSKGLSASMTLMSETRPLPTRPPLSPLSTNSSELRSDSSSSSGSHSPYSANSENFYFPILSAEGHLLPPPPTSSRRSWIDARPSDLSERPLPTPPPVTSPIFAPIPRTPKRWSFGPTHDESLSPERKDSAVIGLYAGIEIGGDGSFELLRDDHDISPRGIRSSPTMTRVARKAGMYQPQRATFHRSLSAEGEDLEYEAGSSGHGHRL